MTDIKPFNEKKHYHLQIFCHTLILLFVLTSLIILHVNRPQFLASALITCIGIAILCLFSVIVQPEHIKSSHKIKFWRKFLQWCGFLIAIYIDLLTLKYGMASSTSVGIFALILLAATLFFVGTIDNFPMALSGISIAIMVGSTIILPTYWLPAAALLVIIMALVTFWLIRHHYLQVVNE